MFKYLFVILCFSVGYASNMHGQKIESLKKAKSSTELSNTNSIIYGLFIQRLGFSSGGFPQYIRLLNIATNEVYSFNVKPTMKTGKEIPFCYYIKPGEYRILNYFWTQSKWYGGLIHQEPIYKNIDTSTNDFAKQNKSGKIDLNNLNFYIIKIADNAINYLGTWHFNTGLVSFSNNKEKLDEEMKEKYQSIYFENAAIRIPE